MTTPGAHSLQDLSLSRSAVDRDYLRRNDAKLFDDLWADPGTRIMVLHKGKTLVEDAGTGAAAAGGGAGSIRLRLFAPDETTAGTIRLYLGRTLPGDPDFPRPTPIVGLVLSDRGAEEIAPDPHSWVGLRDAALALGDRDAGLFTECLALANWHATHTHSPRTGSITIPEQGGWIRRDPVDQSEHFPRTDPAVIMAVIHEGPDGHERLLLAHNAQWPEGRFSTLAGFVEPGESLESAVIREVFEEVGVVARDPQYLGSQPWPFPASLMLGFFAWVDAEQTPEIAVDAVEILDARWFTREELETAARSGEVLLPASSSIARRLVETWLGRTLP